MDNKFDLRPLLDYIEASDCTYQEWVDVGMALHEEGYPVSVWDEWSSRDYNRYHKGECEQKWNSFHSNKGRRLTGATITEMAKMNGWTKLSGKFDAGGVMEWGAVMTANVDLYQIVDKNWIEDSDIEVPNQYSHGRALDDIKSYLRVLFNPSDFVGYVIDAFKTEDGRWQPKSGGNYMRTAGQLLDELEKQNNIANVFGSITEPAGAWIRFNPLDGKGVKNENVTNYRYALLESDVLSVGKQKAILEQLELPIAALVYSGKKSLHAIVKIDATSYEEYRKRVDFVYSIATKNGFKVDKQNRNPSRLSRMPGVSRDGTPQFLVGTNLGKTDFAEWEEWIASINDDLPDMEGLESIWDNLPELAPSLIDGVLRQGHKMLIAGPSKAGKSFALIQLCISIAEGLPWFGFPCTKGKVLYVNLELDRASCLHRFKDVYGALQWKPENLSNISIWNLRGKSVPMDQLAPKLIRRAVQEDYIAIVIDPIYKVITGDENSADQMAKFCNQFDKICNELNCAVIYCHHHSKGSQSGKRSMDRASGSGVFARDPDALIDMMELDVSDDEYEKAQKDSEATAWRLEGTLREYPRFRPVNLWFEYPIHKLDENGWLNVAALDDPAEKGNARSSAKRKAIKKSRVDKLTDAFSAISGFRGKDSAPISEVANYLGIGEKTVRNYITESNLFEIKLGELWRKNEGLQ